jgi:hypothetical protein
MTTMKTKAKLHLVIAFALLAVAGCSDPGDGVPVRGVALRPGEQIEATNKFGTVRISYVSPRERKYEWDGQARVLTMIPRPEPFMNELGLYDPADCFVLCRTPRLVVREAAHDFDTIDQIYSYLWAENATVDWVYSGDGLAVGWARWPDREQVNIDVQQFTIHGQKPVALRGARNGAIRVTQLDHAR